MHPTACADLLLDVTRPPAPLNVLTPVILYFHYSSSSGRSNHQFSFLWWRWHVWSMLAIHPDALCSSSDGVCVAKVEGILFISHLQIMTLYVD